MYISQSYPSKSFCTIFNQTVVKNTLEEEDVVSAVVLFKVKCNLDPLKIIFASARPDELLQNSGF